MDNLKKMFKGMDKKLLIYTGIGIGGMIFVIILISVLVNVFEAKYLSYEEVETELIKSAKVYYEKNKIFLPANEGESTSVQIKALVNSELIQPLDKLLKNGKSCTAEVVVTKNLDSFSYTPYLNCGSEYSSKELYKYLTEKNEIVESGAGLYQINEEYVFRGEVTNNYISLNSKTWKIMKIDNENNIALISDFKMDPAVWDDRYNTEDKSNSGINNFNLSRIKDSLNDYYNSDTYLTKDEKENVLLRKWCIGTHPEDKGPNLKEYECKEMSENELPFGLITVSEYMSASLDNNCKKPTDYSCGNYNYLKSSTTTWTITKGGKNSAFVYSLTSSNFITSRANAERRPRIVVYLNNKTIYKSGDGTISNPYTIR